MKIKPIASRLLASILLAASSAAFAAGDHHAPKHGGVVVETKLADLEFVVKPDVIQIYITDHGKPMKFEGAKAKVTLLNGTEKTEVELVQIGDKLEAKGAFKAVPKSTKGVAVVTLVGKPPATARFEVK
jgi:hypothetical protein